jgi:hypothetical protein
LHLNGYVVTKVTTKPPHVIAGELIRDELIALVPRNDWRVMVEEPVRIPKYNEPEPDVALARGKAKDYTNRHPGISAGRWPAQIQMRPLFQWVKSNPLSSGPVPMTRKLHLSSACQATRPTSAPPSPS